jgi:hypothetical protein
MKGVEARTNGFEAKTTDNLPTPISLPPLVLCMDQRFNGKKQIKSVKTRLKVAYVVK